MSFDFKAAIKKPWVKYSLIGIAVLGVGYILMSRSSSASTSTDSGETSAVDAATVQANAQLSAQQQALAASASAQQSQQDFQLAALKETDATQLAALTATNSSNLALANVQLTGLQDQLTEKQAEATLAAGVQNNNISSSASVAKKNSDNQAIGGAVATIGVLAAAFF